MSPAAARRLRWVLAMSIQKATHGYAKTLLIDPQLTPEQLQNKGVHDFNGDGKLQPHEQAGYFTTHPIDGPRALASIGGDVTLTPEALAKLKTGTDLPSANSTLPIHRAQQMAERVANAFSGWPHFRPDDMWLTKAAVSVETVPLGPIKASTLDSLELAIIKAGKKHGVNQDALPIDERIQLDGVIAGDQKDHLQDMAMGRKLELFLVTVNAQDAEGRTKSFRGVVGGTSIPNGLQDGKSGIIASDEDVMRHLVAIHPEPADLPANTKPRLLSEAQRSKMRADAEKYFAEHQDVRYDPDKKLFREDIHGAKTQAFTGAQVQEELLHTAWQRLVHYGLRVPGGEWVKKTDLEMYPLVNVGGQGVATFKVGANDANVVVHFKSTDRPDGKQDFRLTGVEIANQNLEHRNMGEVGTPFHTAVFGQWLDGAMADALWEEQRRRGMVKGERPGAIDWEKELGLA
jgi:hypothetical protein